MNELMKLVAALTDLAVEATEYLKRENGKPYQPNLPLPTVAAPNPVLTVGEAAAPVPVEEPAKKTRKPRAPKTEVPPPPPPAETEETAIADAAADAAADEAAQKASYEKMMDITKQWVLLAKNDTPMDGKTWAMKELRAMGVEKLTDFSHEQRLSWIVKMEGAIAAHK